MRKTCWFGKFALPFRCKFARDYCYEVNARFHNGYWDDKANQRKFLDRVASAELISSPEEWISGNMYSLLCKHGGSALTTKYSNTWEMLLAIYPDHPWPNIPPKLPRNYWDNKQNQISFWKHIIDQYNLPGPHEIPNNVPIKDIKRLGGRSLLEKHSDLLSAIRFSYPDIKWPISVRKKWESKFWDSVTNQREFLESIAPPLRIQKLDDWLQIHSVDIIKQGGRMLYSRYSSLREALAAVYPNHNWNIDMELDKPRNYWRTIKNQRNFMEGLEKELGVTERSQWLNISLSTQTRLRHIVTKYYTSFFNALRVIFPEYNWVKPPLEEQREQFEKLRSQLKISTEELISLPPITLRVHGYAHLMAFYKNYNELVRAVYPEIKWKAQQRKQKPLGYWDTDSNIHTFMNNVKKNLQIEKDEDWYRVSIPQIQKEGGAGLLRKFNSSLCQLLKHCYPSIEWDSMRLKRTDKRSAQRYLLVRLKELLPDEEIIEEYIHHDVTRKSMAKVEFDIFLPKRKIAFEYHGVQHYIDIPSFAPLELYKKRDLEKERLCSEYDIELCVIPYSWDGTHKELLSICSKYSLRFCELVGNNLLRFNLEPKWSNN